MTLPAPSMRASSPASSSRPQSQRLDSRSIGESEVRTTPVPQAPNSRRRFRSPSNRSPSMGTSIALMFVSLPAPGVPMTRNSSEASPRTDKARSEPPWERGHPPLPPCGGRFARNGPQAPGFPPEGAPTRFDLTARALAIPSGVPPPCCESTLEGALLGARASRPHGQWRASGPLRAGRPRSQGGSATGNPFMRRGGQSDHARFEQSRASGPLRAGCPRSREVAEIRLNRRGGGFPRSRPMFRLRTANR